MLGLYIVHYFFKSELLDHRFVVWKKSTQTPAFQKTGPKRRRFRWNPTYDTRVAYPISFPLRSFILRKS